MREIINPWVGMSGYNCYGCSPTNPIGAHMRFFDENTDDKNADIVSVWQPTQDHQSWLDTLHGGMQATLLDEVCGWVVFHKLETSGVTAKMEIRYRKPVSTRKGALILRARLKSDSHRVAIVEGEIWSDGERCCSCECTYFYFDEEKAKEMGYRKPHLADEVKLDEVLAQAKQYKPINISML